MLLKIRLSQSHEPVSAIRSKGRSFLAHWWEWRKDRLALDESHTQPDKVSGSLIRSTLGRGSRGVLIYQPLQTCLSVHSSFGLSLGKPEPGSQGVLQIGVSLLSCQLERWGYWIHQSCWQGVWVGRGAGAAREQSKAWTQGSWEE